MIAMPFQILGWWLRSSISVLALCGGIALILNAGAFAPSKPNVVIHQDDTGGSDDERLSPGSEPEKVRATEHTTDQRPWEIGWNLPTGVFLFGIALVLWSLGGRWLSGTLFRPHDATFPREDTSGVVARIDRPDGTQLHVECFGKPDGVPLVLTHGWGLDSREWLPCRRELENRCRIIVWDLPGLGRSKGPNNRDWSLEKLAGDREAVISWSGNRPVILAGHSIGGMIILTYYRLFPQKRSQQVAGIVLGQTTYKNPVETTSMAAFYRAIQKPVLEPLCYLMIAVAPLAWVMNCWSYCNGSVHRTNHKSFFSGAESREQLRFISRYSLQSWPGVVARGLLGMFRFDATAILPSITVPTIVIDGRRDSSCLPEASKQMVELIPGARSISLVNAEHGGIFEFHQHFAEAIHELISTSLSHFERQSAIEWNETVKRGK